MRLKGVIAKINKARDAYIVRREKEAEQNLERLKTKTAREKERARLVKERAKVREEADRAKASAIRAEVERKKAERELREMGTFSRIMKSLTGGGKVKKATKRSVIKKKARRTRKSKR